MSNKFKVGDSFTLVNPLTLDLDDQIVWSRVVRDTTQGKVYLVSSVGKPPVGAPDNPEEDGTGVYFTDDAGYTVQLRPEHLVPA